MFQRDFATAEPRQESWRDWLVPQAWGHFTAEDHGVWDTLFARQMPYLRTRVVSPFLEGVRALGLDQPGIPELGRLNARLESLTGWRCVAVAGLVPDAVFFAMLAERRFPIGNFIRDGDSLDYLEQPDCFHDIFGHVPLIAHPPVAQMMQAMGTLGVAAIAAGLGDMMARLYWHTIEFGLVQENGAVKILGAGLASSFGEARFALEADVARPRFTMKAAAATGYRSDAFQPLYFVSDSLSSAATAFAAKDLETLNALA